MVRERRRSSARPRIWLPKQLPNSAMRSVPAGVAPGHPPAVDPPPVVGVLCSAGRCREACSVAAVGMFTRLVMNFH